MHCIGSYFHVPTGVHVEARAPEPFAPERAPPPPRRRRACDSPKSRTARQQPHPSPALRPHIYVRLRRRYRAVVDTAAHHSCQLPLQ